MNDPSRPPSPSASAADSSLAGRGGRADLPDFVDIGRWPRVVAGRERNVRTRGCNSDVRDHHASRCRKSPGTAASRTFAGAAQPDHEPPRPLVIVDGSTTVGALWQVKAWMVGCIYQGLTDCETLPRQGQGSSSVSTLRYPDGRNGWRISAPSAPMMLSPSHSKSQKTDDQRPRRYGAPLQPSAEPPTTVFGPDWLVNG